MALLWSALLGAAAEESRFGRDGRLWHLKTLPRPGFRVTRSAFARSQCHRGVRVNGVTFHSGVGAPVRWKLLAGTLEAKLGGAAASFIQLEL